MNARPTAFRSGHRLALARVQATLGMALLAAIVWVALLTPLEPVAPSAAFANQVYLPLVQVPAPTPTPTLRPHSGIRMGYALAIETPQRVRVTVAARDVQASSLSLYRVLMYDPATLPPVQILSVSDNSGHSLVYALSLLGAGTPRPAQELTITTAGASELRVDYALDLSSQLYWLADGKTIGLPETALFFQPLADFVAVGEMRFQFIVPSPWRVVTRLIPDQGATWPIWMTSCVCPWHPAGGAWCSRDPLPLAISR